LRGQNLITNEKAYIETIPVATFFNLDPNNLLGVTLFKYEFPDSMSVQKFNEIGLKLVNAAGAKTPLSENANTTVSNQVANRVAVRIDEGPIKGEIILIAFFEGNTITNVDLGPINNEDPESVIEKIIDSIKINH